MTKRMDDDLLAELKRVLAYDPTTGDITWAVKASRKVVAGAIAGRTRADGYKKVGFKYREHLAHRLAWQFVHGAIPDGMEIDHIDGNPSNNAISNLRLATHSQNGQNKKGARRDNLSSGLLGVSWFARTSQWRARIYIDGKERSLGYFADKLAAYEAYKAAKLAHHFTGALA